MPLDFVHVHEALYYETTVPFGSRATTAGALDISTRLEALCGLHETMDGPMFAFPRPNSKVIVVKKLGHGRAASAGPVHLLK